MPVNQNDVFGDENPLKRSRGLIGENSIGRGRPLTQALLDMKKKKEGEFDINKYLQDQLTSEFPQDEVGRRTNVFGQQMTGMEQRQMRQFQEQFAGRTGGRMSSARGGAEIGGQAAIARATGVSQIMTQAFNQEMQNKQVALQAYIQKYGIDTQAKLAMEQLKLQREQAEGGFWSDIASFAGNLLPFFFSPSSVDMDNNFYGSGSGDLEGAGFDFDPSYGELA